MKSKLLTALLCFVVAFCLWTYVITMVSLDSESTFTNIPVEIKNTNVLTDRGLMIFGDEIPTVTLRLAGNRSDLLKLNSQNITVQVDASKIIEAGTAELGYTVSFPGDVPNNALTIQSRNPDYIILDVVERVEKLIPVEFSINKEAVPENYISADPVTDVTQVRVSGPKERVEQIAKAVVTIDLTGRTQSVHENFTYTLCNEEGEPVDAKYVQTDKEQIFVDMLIRRYKVIPLKLTVIPGGGATENDVTYTLSPDEIMVYGSESALAQLEYLDVGTLELSQLANNQTLTFPINLPEGITHETGQGAVVTVELAFNNLEVKHLSVSNLLLENVPESMSAKSYTATVDVTVRGPKELVTLINASYLTLVADLNDVTPGPHVLPVTVKIDEKFAAVGAVGTYSVTVHVNENGG